MADEDRDNVLNKLLLNAARTDNVDQLLDEVFSKPGEFDINYQDGCVVSSTCSMWLTRPVQHWEYRWARYVNHTSLK
jgi:hypothetical protein